MLPTTSAYNNLISQDVHNFKLILSFKPKFSESYIKHFYVEQCTDFIYDDGCVADVFELGCTFAKNFSFTILDPDYELATFAFSGADVRLMIGLQDPAYGTVTDYEYAIWLTKGYFIVTNVPSIKNGKIKIEVADYMATKLNRPYLPDMFVWPETAGYVRYVDMVIGICNACGVECDTLTFNHYDGDPRGLACANFPEVYGLFGLNKYTCRDIIGFIAQIAMGYARFSAEGKLQIISFPAAESSELDYHGGTFEVGTTPYGDGINADGGDFTTYAGSEPPSTMQYDGGDFSTKTHHAINSFYSIDVVPYALSFDGAVVESYYGGVYEHIRPMNSTYLERAIVIRGNPFLYRSDVANAVADEIISTFVTSYRMYYQFEAETPVDVSREAGDKITLSTPEGYVYNTLLLKYHLDLGKPEEISSNFGADEDMSWTLTDNVYTET